MSAAPTKHELQVVRDQYPGAIILVKHGDFLEAFDEDAETLHEHLGLTLTLTGTGANARPLTGMPRHSADQYIDLVICNTNRQVFIVDYDDITD